MRKSRYAMLMVMRNNSTITLSSELMTALTPFMGKYNSTQALVEEMLWQFVSKAQLHARDRLLIEKYADALNAEAEDALEYQALS